MSSNDIWKQFVIFWTTPVESELQDEYPKCTYPTNLVGVCELGYEECSQFKDPKIAMIYIIENWGDDDVRQYCEKCYKQSKFLLKQCDKILKFSLQMQLYLDNSVFSSITLVNLVNDLLDLAKMESATLTMNNEHVNLVEAVQQAF